MMAAVSTYRIAEVALARLAFISRAKQLGCSLDEISDLVGAWDTGRCEPVPTRLRELVATKIAEAQDRINELVTFTAQLQEAAAVLHGRTPAGPCDDECGCTTSTVLPTPVKTAVALSTKPPGIAEQAIACTLGVGEIAERIAAWRAVLAKVVGRERIEGGRRLTFGRGTSMATVVDLAEAEQRCCSFFRFAITVDGRGLALEVSAPESANEIVEALFGGAK